MANIVQVKTSDATTAPEGVSATLTLNQAPTAGNLIIVIHHSAGGGSSDETFAPAGFATAFRSIEGTQKSIFYKVAGAGESTSVTVTQALSRNQTMTLLEVAGLVADQATVLDRFHTAKSPTSTTTFTAGPTPTTQTANEFIVATVGFTGSPGGTWSSYIAWSDSFNHVGISEGSGTSSTGVRTAVSARTVSAIGAYQTTTSWTNSRTALSSIATFRSLGGAAPGTTVSINQNDPQSVQVGSTLQLTATVNNGSGSTVWSSNATGIATVNSSTGLVTGVAVGSAQITATNNGVSSTITVNVTTAAAAGTISGNIRLEDIVVSGARVYAITAAHTVAGTALTNTSGNYSITGLAAGTYDIFVRYRDSYNDPFVQGVLGVVVT